MGEHMSAGSCGGQKSTSDSLELDAGNQDYPQNSEFFFSNLVVVSLFM